MTAAFVVDLQNVSLIYSTGALFGRSTLQAVRHLTLQISPGETMGLVGESGSGKSSVGRLCLGIARPTEGTALFKGRSLPRRLSKLRGQLALVLQNPDWSLNPRLRV